jgi:hypothetical protein
VALGRTCHGDGEGVIGSLLGNILESEFLLDSVRIMIPYLIVNTLVADSRENIKRKQSSGRCLA